MMFGNAYTFIFPLSWVNFLVRHRVAAAASVVIYYFGAHLELFYLLGVSDTSFQLGLYGSGPSDQPLWPILQFIYFTISFVSIFCLLLSFEHVWLRRRWRWFFFMLITFPLGIGVVLYLLVGLRNEGEWPYTHSGKPG